MNGGWEELQKKMTPVSYEPIYKIDGELSYPIYSFTAKWIQDGKYDPEYPNWNEGLPEGRVWNSTHFTEMYKEAKSQEELDAIAKEWWGKYLANPKTRIVNPELTELTVKYYEHETWHLTWFQHETFETGMSDEEVLNSFEKFVRRKEEYNMRNRYEDGTGKYCLMGAEDRWRWRGAGTTGERDDEGPAPCRCKYCKEQGVVRIAH